MRVERRKERGLGAVGAVLCTAQRNRCYVLHLPGRDVKLRHFTAAAAVDNVGIEGIGRDVAVFDGGDRMPVPNVDRAIVPPAGNANRTAFLLSGTHAIRKCIAHSDVIKLSGWLVVPRTPGLAPVDGDDCALIADQKNNVWVDRIDPEILVVV